LGHRRHFLCRMNFLRCLDIFLNVFEHDHSLSLVFPFLTSQMVSEKTSKKHQHLKSCAVKRNYVPRVDDGTSVVRELPQKSCCYDNDGSALSFARGAQHAFSCPLRQTPRFMQHVLVVLHYEALTTLTKCIFCNSLLGFLLPWMHYCVFFYLLSFDKFRTAVASSGACVLCSCGS